MFSRTEDKSTTACVMAALALLAVSPRSFALDERTTEIPAEGIECDAQREAIDGEESVDELGASRLSRGFTLEADRNTLPFIDLPPASTNDSAPAEASETSETGPSITAGATPGARRISGTRTDGS